MRTSFQSFNRCTGVSCAVLDIQSSWTRSSRINRFVQVPSGSISELDYLGNLCCQLASHILTANVLGQATSKAERGRPRPGKCLSSQNTGGPLIRTLLISAYAFIVLPWALDASSDVPFDRDDGFSKAQWLGVIRADCRSLHRVICATCGCQGSEYNQSFRQNNRRLRKTSDLCCAVGRGQFPQAPSSASPH
jgi:hypothetical protein